MQSETVVEYFEFWEAAKIFEHLGIFLPIELFQAAKSGRVSFLIRTAFEGFRATKANDFFFFESYVVKRDDKLNSLIITKAELIKNLPPHVEIVSTSLTVRSGRFSGLKVEKKLTFVGLKNLNEDDGSFKEKKPRKTIRKPFQVANTKVRNDEIREFAKELIKGNKEKYVKNSGRPNFSALISKIYSLSNSTKCDLKSNLRKLSRDVVRRALTNLKVPKNIND